MTSAPDQPTLITLNHELMQSHRRDAVVKRTLPQPPGIPREFTVDATTGDTCVFLDNLTGLATGHEVQITGVPGKDEYHRLATFSVLSDADGYYRLPPLSRVAQIEIHAETSRGNTNIRSDHSFSSRLSPARESSRSHAYRVADRPEMRTVPLTGTNSRMREDCDA